MRLPKRILVGVDFSEPSLAALEYGIRLFERAGATLWIVHVLKPRRALQRSGRDQSRPEAADRLRHAAGSLGLEPSLRARLMVCSGEPLDILCSAALEANSTLILVGRTGRGGAADTGRVTRRLVECAPCPVIPIRESERGVLPHVTGCPA